MADKKTKKSIRKTPRVSVKSLKVKIDNIEKELEESIRQVKQIADFRLNEIIDE